MFRAESRDLERYLHDCREDFKPNPERFLAKKIIVSSPGKCSWEAQCPGTLGCLGSRLGDAAAIPFPSLLHKAGWGCWPLAVSRKGLLLPMWVFLRFEMFSPFYIDEVGTFLYVHAEKQTNTRQ